MLNRFSLALLALLLPAAAFAQAPDNSRIGYTQTGGCPGTPAPPTCFVQYGSTIPIVGTITATLGGFAPNGAYSTPLSVSGTTSNVALPVGSPAATVVVVSNIGTTNTAYVNLGTSGSVTATTADMPIPPQSSIALTIGTNTFLAAITSTSTTTLNIAGGAGLFTGFGGGGGSGGGGGGGTSSNFGSAFPTAGTAFGLTDGTNMIGLKGSATLGAFMNLAGVNGAAVAVGHGVAATALRVELPTDGTGTVGLNAGLNDIGSVDQHGTWNITNISGTISLPTGAATSALQATGNTALTTINSTLGTPMQATGGTVGLVAGSAIVGNFRFDQTTPGTTNGVVVNSGSISANPGARTLVTLDVKTVTTGGTAVTALTSGHKTAGGWLMNPVGATINLCINEIGTATGTTSSGDTTCIVPGQTYTLAPSSGAVSVISSDSSHPFSGYGLQ